MGQGAISESLVNAVVKALEGFKKLGMGGATVGKSLANIDNVQVLTLNLLKALYEGSFKRPSYVFLYFAFPPPPQYPKIAGITPPPPYPNIPPTYPTPPPHTPISPHLPYPTPPYQGGVG